MSNITKDFRTFVLNRVEDVTGHLTNENYIEYQKKTEKMLEKIRDLLPEKEKHLVVQLEELYQDLSSIEMEHAYRHAFKDTFDIMKNI